MPFSMSQASLPVFEIGLNALSGVLDKTAAYAASKKVDLAVLLGWRLAPAMFALARQMKGGDFLNHFVLPNFYFHLTAAYAIVRHCGVELGKRDFLGAIPIKRL